jgi:hypothetical protein
VASFQLCLLLYLFYSDHTTGVLHFEGLFSQADREFRLALNAMILQFAGLIVVGAVVYAAYHWYRVSLASGCQNVLEESPLN